MIFDLHTHTNVSDGTLAPSSLVDLARERAVDVVSITDHDTLEAYDWIERRPGTLPEIVTGIEWSTRWRTIGIHVLGLNFRLDDPSLREAVRAQGVNRRERAEVIAHRLARLGVPDAMPRVREIAGPALVGRPHFARYLVEIGKVKSTAAAFKKYLGRGKPGDVKFDAVSMADVIAITREAGGIAVLAHPAKYGLTHRKLDQLLEDFRTAGGEGVEVVSGLQSPELTARLAALSQAHGLLASCGSDFHAPDCAWAELGRHSVLPEGCRPVWERW